MLGGASRESIRIYIDFHTEPLRLAKSLAESGVKAMKIRRFDPIAPETEGQYVAADQLRKGLEPIRQIRERLGDSVDVAMEAQGFWNLPSAPPTFSRLQPQALGRGRSRGRLVGKTEAICLLCGLLMHPLAPLTAQTTTYSLSVGFSLERNPNLVWQYGYSLTNSLAPDQFRLDTSADTSDLVGFWHPAESDGTGPGYYPYVASNTTSQARTNATNGWAVRAGEVAMEGSNTGQYSLIRFVAPKAGAYKIAARFEGIHFRLSSTDVHVLHNATSLFDAEINGYGGDPRFHPIQGSNPTASYTGSVQLMAGDTITFAVGYGQNKTHYNDTTGLSAEITLLPKKVSEKQNGQGKPDRQ